MFDALTSFTFNLGGGALQMSTLRSRLNRSEYSWAAEEFENWIYVRVNGILVKSNGLLHRRAAERGLFLSDTDDTEE
jgi:lysozyme